LRVCVFGAGAIGGYLAAHLIASKAADVSIVARGGHLRAMQVHGLRVRTPVGEVIAHPVAATDRASDLPPQDIVFVALKSTSYAAAAESIASLMVPGGHVVCVGNGIQWWWPAGIRQESSVESAFRRTIEWKSIGVERALGCVPYSINEVVQPGIVQHSGNNRWIVGEPDNSSSARLEATVTLMRAAGLNSEASTDIRREIWIKLLRNAPLNALCALTRLPIDGLAGEPGLMALLNQIIDEVVAIARAYGWELPAETINVARSSPGKGGGLDGQRIGIKPSMLQDVLAGRAMEVEAIVGVPQRLAREAGVETPALDVIVPLLRGLQGTWRPGPFGPG
jgi:2-dehydropantoate 2-reductase